MANVDCIGPRIPLRSPHSILAACVLSLPLAGPCLGQNTWTVSPSGKADFATIQDAIDAATSGDTILVHPGVYTSTGSEVVNFNSKNVWVVGVEGPDSTVIDGELQRRCVVFAAGESRDARLDGIAVYRGHAPDGGGIYFADSSPTIFNCLVSDCETISDGGGLFLDEAAQPLISQCVIAHNHARGSGGGVYARQSMEWLIEGSTVQHNTASLFGGGLYIAKKSNGQINDSVIESNDAQDGGGLYIDWSIVSVDNTRITGNIAYTGAGVHALLGDVATLDCQIDSNEANTFGGGLYINSGSTMTGGEIRGNVAPAGGGLVIEEGANPVMTSVWFVENEAEKGAGVRVKSDADPAFIDCTFEANVATGDGAGVYCDNNSWPEFLGTVFRDNGAQRGGGIFAYGNPFGNPSGSFPSISSCEFRGNQAEAGAGLYSDSHSLAEIAKTMFCGNVTGHLYGDWTDIGGNDFLEECEAPCPGDVDGDGDVGVNDILAIISLWGSNDPAGDLNGDGLVGTDDLLLILSQWGSCP